MNTELQPRWAGWVRDDLPVSEPVHCGWHIVCRHDTHPECFEQLLRMTGLPKHSDRLAVVLANTHPGDMVGDVRRASASDSTPTTQKAKPPGRSRRIRNLILAALRDGSWQTAAALCRSVSAHKQSVSNAIGYAITDGLVVRRKAKVRGPGKPAWEYALAEMVELAAT